MIASAFLALAPSFVELPESQPLQQGPAPAARDAKNSTFSYTYAQLELVLGDADGFSNGPDGFEISGSYALQSNLFVLAGVSFLSGDVGPANVDVDTLELGIGYHQPLAAQTDLVLTGSFLHANADPGSDGNGYKLGGGVRHLASQQFEVDGSIGYTDYDFSSGTMWLELGGIFRANPNLGVLATVYTDDDIDTFSIGVRWTP